MNLASLVFLLAGSVSATSLPPLADPSTQSTASAGLADSPAIIVTAPIDRSRLDTLQGVSILEGEQLQRRLEPTLGETLAREPGVSSTFFGPGASRPLIRGQGGERIRVLNDGIGNFDVSTTSVDHVVAADPLSAERIEIVRGPAALLYGDAASGGVVNVIEGRIPRSPVSGVEGEALGFYGSNADALNATAEIDWSPSTRVALHADVFAREQSDYRSGSGALVPNSALQSSGAAAGGSWFSESGFVGGNVSSFGSRYEIPGDVVFIDAEQVRGDLAAEYKLKLLGLSSVRVRAGYADYDHREIDNAGVVATTFANREFEGRIDFRHRPIGRLTGAFGVQLRDRRFEAVGLEAFVPPSSFRQLGVFVFERAEWSKIAIEGGLRYSRSDLNTEGSADAAQFVPASRLRFETVSGSLGAGYQFAGGGLVGASVYRTERAPALEELFANGPHAATGTYEIGDPALSPELARGLELTARYVKGSLSVEANIFAATYQGYIVERETGAVRSGLPVLRFEASDARFWGGELAVQLPFGRLVPGSVQLDLLADLVRARDRRRDEPLPRIPPARLIAGLDYALTGQFSVRAELIHAKAQSRVSALEAPTGGYTLLNLSASVTVARRAELQLRAANLTDAFARAHTSFLRDRAPLPGRDVRLLFRTKF